MRKITIITIIGILLLSSLTITPALAENEISVEARDPTDGQKDVDINKELVQVSIDHPDDLPFDWVIRGDYIIETSVENDIEGIKEAPIDGTLPYNEEIIWFVDVTDEEGSKTVTFSFITIPETITIEIKNENPTNESTEISITKDNVSVEISIFAPHFPIPFNWTIAGKNITTVSGINEISSRIEAKLETPLDYNTRIDWYVNISVGDIYKNVSYSFITEEPPNQPPNANFTFKDQGLLVDFDGALSNDSDGEVVNWTWDFNDGNFSYDNITQHLYENDGNYSVTLTVRDEDGAEDSITKWVNVTNVPPVANFTFSVDENVVTFDSSNSYDVDGAIVNYTWSFGDGKKSYEKNPVHTYAVDNTQLTPYSFNVILNVTDDKGAYSIYNDEVIIGDNTDPTVVIVEPKRAIYLGNKFIILRLFRIALIIGDITIEVDASDNGFGIEKVEFYNGLFGTNLMGNDTEAPYNLTWKRDRIRLFHIHTLKVVAYDKAGNTGEAKMIVRKLL